jgi:hypothetical protein
MKTILRAATLCAAILSSQAAPCAEPVPCMDVTDPNHPVACDFHKMEETLANEFRFDRDYKGHKVTTYGFLDRVAKNELILNAPVCCGGFYCSSSSVDLFPEVVEWKRSEKIMITGEIWGLKSISTWELKNCQAKRIK